MYAGWVCSGVGRICSPIGRDVLGLEVPPPFGLRVDVYVQLAKRENVLVVPSQTVQTGQEGEYVFLVKPDMTAAVTQVKVGRTVNGETEIVDGLSEGQTVVTDGQIRLAPGTKVYFTKGL